MRSFEIFVGAEPAAASFDPRPSAPSVPASGLRRVPRRRAREVLDIFIGGANVTARVADVHASSIVRDLGEAVSELARAPRGKSIVRFYDDPWELCIERAGAVASLSVYRAGAEPHVAVHDARAPFAEIVDAVREALAQAIARASAPAAVDVELRAAADALACAGLAVNDVDDPRDADAGFTVSLATVEIDRDAPIALGADLALRVALPDTSSLRSAREPIESRVERPDLHALLFRGKMRAEVRGRAMELGEGHPFLFCERLLAMCHQALDAWEHGRAHYARSVAGGFVIAIRLSPTGDASLTLGEGRPGADALTTFPCLAVPDLVESCLSFGRGVVRAVLRRDRAQCVNLRLTSFRRQLRETSDALREVCREDSKINPTPEPYRAFVSSQRSSSTTSHAPMPLTAGRLRYVPRWRALVPGIDLRATFLCGDRMIVGASAETFCLERATGEVIWRMPTERATAVVTPGGIARLAPDGELAVHDFGNGEITMRTQIAPRLGAPPTGAVVNVPGLPKLLIVTEGDRHLVAIDLASGEARWRFAWNTQGRTSSGERARGGALRMKRAGRLLYIASGDSALTALDVQTGRVVWRVRNRLRFRSAPTVDHDRLFALTGGVNSPAELLAVDAFTGEVRWRSPVLEGGGPCTVEGAPLVASHAVACAIRDRHGLKLAAFDREDGVPLWTSEAPVAPVGTSWLAVDDLFIGNSPTGELSAIRAEGGSLLYRHLLGRVLEADVPHHLKPILRAGALFVPHTDVHVFRPSDGTPLGTVGPCDAIPDLLRVDERCDVYVAEESGHLCSFGVGPRLSLVR